MKTKPNQNGIALIMMLWMMAILSVLVLSFSAATKVDTFAAASFKNGIGNKFLAEAGIQRGIMEIYYTKQNKNTDILFADQEIFRLDGTAYQGDLDSGHYVIRITDESGKININTLTDSSGVLLSNLLVNLGLGKEEADSIVDAILDWKDSDELVRLHGAESEYYQSLPNPYKSKNAPFDTIDELLRVKGITPDVLYGTDNRRGLIHFITLNSNSDKISLKTAPKEILMAIPGMTDDTAESILANRQSLKSDSTLQNIQAALGSGYLSVAPYVSIGESNTFLIDSLGYEENEKNGYRIRTIISIKGPNKYQTLYYKTPCRVKP